MNNPLVEAIESELNNLGINNAKIIYDSYDPDSFGNAEAIYELDNIRFYFVRDRGQDILSLSSKISPDNYYLFSDVSAMMGWESLDEIINVIEPISLNKALGYIKADLSQLNHLFSNNEIMTTNSKLKLAEQKRTKAMFG